MLLIFVGACVPVRQHDTENGDIDRQFRNSFSIAPQVPPPQSIQSIQLYRKGDAASPPVIELGSQQGLVLEFDHLDSEATQFNIFVRHYARNWTESSLPLNFYLGGFYEDYFGAGVKSFTQRPTYRHYKYELPNHRISINASGNYLVTVVDSESGQQLFSLPFFVTEDQGKLETRVETEFARRRDLREQDRPFSRYLYPGFVEMPRFDLSFYYVQNQFWGRAREVNTYDTSTPGHVHFHLSQDQAFLGDYEFNTLDVRSFSVDGTRILSYEPETIPPTLVLRRDIQRFAPITPFPGGSRLGLPVDSRGAEYANVHFKLETAVPSDSLQQIYLVGDFNEWNINRLNRMKYIAESGLWEGRTFIKQGEYAYKYVTIEGNRINDLSLDRSFTYRSQEYLTFVYYRDPVRHYDRLLKVEKTVH
ncbi:MAG: DUF5103 domain-containing protein [Balneolaceae bacterium]|nr:DUF5103 domain-containing protein [Balneolaceae bacterium]